MSNKTPIIQAWNGKWHIFEKSLGWVPAQPVDDWNRVAKPKRLRVLVRCGLEVYSKRELREISKRSDFTFITKDGWERDSITFCKNCRATIDARYPKPKVRT